MAKNNELDMLNGALLPKILMFSLPLALTGILQLLFNAADVIVVGKFAGSTSLAAVGATSALINLLTGAFIGISVGVNILVARYAGCRDDVRVERAVHSAIALSLVLGVVTFLLGFFSLPRRCSNGWTRRTTFWRWPASICASTSSAFPAR